MCLADDERLDALLESLDKKAPDVEEGGVEEREDEASGFTVQISGPVAAEFAEVHQAVQKLSKSFVQKFGPMVQ